MGANRRYLQTDHQGSVVSVADAGGNSLNTLTYDPWGIPASSNVGRFQYTGQAILPELGMYHYKARIYSPTLGRFLQTDPIGYKDQINLYAYVANDPVDGRDPSGLYACGASLTGDDCTAFKEAQTQAKAALAASQSLLRSIMLKGGKDLNSAENKFAQTLNKYFGKGSSTDNKFLSRLDSRIGQAAAKLASSFVPAERVSGIVGHPNALAGHYGSGTVIVTNNFFSKGADRIGALIHEPDHGYGSNELQSHSVEVYGRSAAAALAQSDRDYARDNADNFRWAVGPQ